MVLSVAPLLPVPVVTPAQITPDAGSSFIVRYQARVTATRNEQPHWVMPLVKVTPRLEQEFRTDFVRLYNPGRLPRFEQ
jgi:hypothetical protein